MRPSRQFGTKTVQVGTEAWRGREWTEIEETEIEDRVKMRIKMPAVRIAQADADSAEVGAGSPGALPSPPDTLTCGACRRNFALADIVRFIQHKIASCDKDPSFGHCFSAGPGSDGEDGSRPAAQLSAGSARRPALLTRRVHTPPLAASPTLPAPPDLIQDGGASSTPKRLLDDEASTSTPKRRASTSPPSSSPDEDVKPRIKQERVDVSAHHATHDQQRKSRDAESNTMHTEPSNYVCSTCSARVHSAWRMLQHVQHAHGVPLYVESSPPPPPHAAAPPAQPAAKPSSAPPPPLRHHPLLPPPDMHSPFGLLRMPLPASLPSMHSPGPPAPLFARPTIHDHRFRMEQLVSEQFRHHGLNLAAAAAAVAATTLPPPPPFPSPAERPPPPAAPRDRPPPSSQPLSLEPQLDFYSQRLRQLAGTTSPGAAAGNSSSPSPRKRSPPFASPSPSRAGSTPPASGAGPTAEAPSPLRSTPPDRRCEPSVATEPPQPPPASTATTLPPPAPRPPRATPPSDAALHACEFCGKKFRFRSNLLVHRRAHTGEKPYKCSVCDHACAQSSKLKRHMKVHRAADERGDADSPDSGDASDSEEEDEEGEEEEEEEDEELDEEEEEAEDLTVSNGGPPPQRRPRPPPASLVGELMDKFGLSNIAQYSEAYKQALQESGNALKWQLSSKDRDNNNGLGAVPPGADKLNGLPPVGSLRLKEEFAKLPGAGHPLFNPFENPFEASKRMKLDMERGEGWWLPALHAQRPPDGLFDGLKGSGNGLLQSPLLKSKDGRRNDTCEFCGKVFKNCSNLTVHRRSHTGEKPYKCELCSYACAQSSKLTRHMKTHGRLGKDVYRCRFCEMPFSVPSTLEKHMRKCVVNQSNGGGSLGALSDDSSACREEAT